MYSPIKSALNEFFMQQAIETRRVFHGRGHLFEGLEHLNLDWFKPLLLITAYDELVDLDELLQCIVAADKLQQISAIVLQRRYQQGAPAELLCGEKYDQCLVEEGGLFFEVHPGKQQNAGLFLDMRPLRHWLQHNSQERNVLNLFAYTCSLSVAAMAGGAKQVVNVDMSKTSIQWGEKNHRHNKQDLRRVRSIPHNIFRSWGRISQFGRYHTILIDPPTRQRGSFNAEKNYGAVLKKLKSLCHPQADVIASLNSPYLGPEFLLNHFQRYAPQCRLISEMPAAPEFADKYPERGLKIYHFRSQ